MRTRNTVFVELFTISANHLSVEKSGSVENGPEM